MGDLKAESYDKEYWNQIVPQILWFIEQCRVVADEETLSALLFIAQKIGCPTIYTDFEFEFSNVLSQTLYLDLLILEDEGWVVNTRQEGTLKLTEKGKERVQKIDCLEKHKDMLSVLFKSEPKKLKLLARIINIATQENQWNKEKIAERIFTTRLIPPDFIQETWDGFSDLIERLQKDIK